MSTLANETSPVRSVPGGGTPSQATSQKRTIAKRNRESSTPDGAARKKLKTEASTTYTPSTQKKNADPKRPHKPVSCNTSFDATNASQLDFTSQGDELTEDVMMNVNKENVRPVGSQHDVTLGSQDILEFDEADTGLTVHLEPLGELDEDMTTPENVCSTGTGSDDESSEKEDDMCNERPVMTPNVTQGSIILDERSKDSVLETPAASANVSQTGPVDTCADAGVEISVKAMNFGPPNETPTAEEVAAIATEAAGVACLADDKPAPPKSYCQVM